MHLRRQCGNTAYSGSPAQWCDPGPLKEAFPRLFSISTQKNSFIMHMGSWHEGSWVWNLTWRRLLYDWEQEDIVRLTHIIGKIQPIVSSTDGVLWRGSGNTSFHVKSILNKIYESSSPLIPRQSAISIWKSHSPPRAQMTIWLAHLEKLKTGDILMDKGIITPQQALCPFYSLEVETNSHVLFTCTFSNINIYKNIISFQFITCIYLNL